MLLVRSHNYFIYIVTNPERQVLYIGVTNNLIYRLIEHYINRGQPETFAGKYFCYNLIYYEEFQYVNEAIAREKELKKWRREKKVKLIKTMNPNWIFLNGQVCEGWPPKEIPTRY
jgi:putative endonuclease